MKKGIVYLLLLASPIPVLAESNEGVLNSVTLTYNWQPGIRAKLEYEVEKTKTTRGITKRSSLTGKSTMITVKQGDGIRVDFVDTSTTVKTDDKNTQNKFQNMLKNLTAVTPSYLVDSKGEITEVVGLEELRTKMLREIDKLLEGAESKEKQKFTRLINAMLSREQISAQIMQQWNRDVGQWIGANFEEGYVYKIDYEAPIPMIGNAPIPFKGEYSYLGKTKCNDKDKGESCVKLKYQSHIDEKGASVLLVKVFEKMGISKDKAEKIKLSIDYELDVISDPFTLYPFSVREVKIVKSPAPEGKPRAEQIEISRFKYTYVE